jgi:catechol 2,3-dioxygenase-like lactoylglutathione lyase family enzyme
MSVFSFDHLVLNVADAEKSLAFYCNELGLAPVRVDLWRNGEVHFPSVRIDDYTIIDLVETARSGENVNHFCLVVEPSFFDKLIASGRMLAEPELRYGARGDGMSAYLQDPDGNVLELRHYS